MYIAQKMMKTVTVCCYGQETELILDMAKGQIGACPVFETREDAEKYADGAGVIEIQYAKESK